MSGTSVSSTSDTRTSAMRRSAHVAAAFVVPLVLLAACERQRAEPDTTPPPATAAPAPAPAATPAAPAAADTYEGRSLEGEDADAAAASAAPPAPEPAMTQADALAMLMAIDEQEIAAADQAISKNVSGKVRQYAEMMRAEHTRSLKDTIGLGGAVSTAPAVTTLRDEDDKELFALEMRNGADYEQAYIEATVRAHTDALALLDGTLLPAATTDNVRKHLAATRDAIIRHLDEANQLAPRTPED